MTTQRLLLLSPDIGDEERFKSMCPYPTIHAFNAAQGYELFHNLRPAWVLARHDTLNWAMDCVDAQLLDIDQLTGLANRPAFMKEAEDLLRPGEGNVALLYFGIDRFTYINETRGTDFGDRVLKAVAERLDNIVRQGDLAARMGGDHFAVLVRNFSSPEALQAIAIRFFNDLSEPLLVAKRRVHLSYSMGIAAWPLCAQTLDQLLNEALIAFRHARQLGGGQYMFFKDAFNADLSRQLLLENHLRYALARDEIEVWYQPQVTAQDEQLCGAEALIRWRHPRLGLISPSEFVPIAEATGQIHAISMFALHRVIEDAQRLHAQSVKIQFGINLSPRQFLYEALLDEITEQLQDASIPHDRLEFEIIESQAMTHLEVAQQTMNALKQLGCSLALDDFGTGYSSLAWLNQLPVDTLKIDQSFVQQLEAPPMQQLIRGICAMAQALDKRLIAEGVEHPQQADFLRSCGVDVLQGYLFGKPMRADAFVASQLAEAP